MTKFLTRFALISTVVVIVIALWLNLNTQQSQTPTGQEPIKIGIITDLTGPAAYWGESTRVGAELAANELITQGYNVELIFEDYQLDTTKALSAAQKLISIDNVDALYTEFNPGAITVGSLTKDLRLLHLYDAAVTSPLENAPYTYKTYLDYQTGCQQIAQKLKDEGINKIGVLKVNLEFGELCLSGVQDVYSDEVLVESYNLGETDFKTQLLKLENNNAAAVINVGFEDDTLNTLKVIREQNLDMKYGTVDDTITEQVKGLYSAELAGVWTFGFKKIDTDFSNRLSNFTDKELTTEYGAALAHTHIKQVVKALDKCTNNYGCITSELDGSPENNTIGFQKFNDHIADLEMQIKQY